MSDNNQQPRRLEIKKYSNRRFYDTTRSQHVTMRQMHDLVCEGYELVIIDATTRADITNMVLTQIILERDPPKLGIFPASVLHEVIRTQQEYLGSVIEQFFAQVLNTHRTSQEQWLRFVRNTLGATTAPMEWTRSIMDAFNPMARTQASGPGPAESREQPGAESPSPQDRDAREAEVERLRRQVEDLTRQVQGMAEGRDNQG